MITKQFIREFREKFNEEIKAFAEAQGVSIKLGNASYDATEVKFQCVVKPKEVNGKPVEQAEFEKYCGLFGLKPEAYNYTGKLGREEYQLVGLNPNAPKYPAVIKKGDKKFRGTKAYIDVLPSELKIER